MRLGVSISLLFLAAGGGRGREEWETGVCMCVRGGLEGRYEWLTI